MALPKAYLTTQKNLDGILAAMQTARAPKKFTQQFLAGLGFKSSSDRLVINVLKALDFLTAGGEPTQRYFDYLDQTQSARVLAEALQDAYADLFEVKRDAQTMSRAELKNKMRTLSQGQLSESVLDKMTMTFHALVRHADFEAAEQVARTGGLAPPSVEVDGPPYDEEGDGKPTDGGESPGAGPPSSENAGRVRIDGLVYNIQIQLPESRDPAVYDALFRSLKTHLMR